MEFLIELIGEFVLEAAGEVCSALFGERLHAFYVGHKLLYVLLGTLLLLGCIALMVAQFARNRNVLGFVLGFIALVGLLVFIGSLKKGQNA